MSSPNLSSFVNPRLLLIAVCTLSLTACRTRPQGPAGDPRIPPGFYVFSFPGVYEGLADVQPIHGGVRVQLLETFEGRFDLVRKGSLNWTIQNDEMSYPGLRRSFSGLGEFAGLGEVVGDAEIWIHMLGRVGRDHRRGTWSLRSASPAEIERFHQRQRSLEARRRRAGLDETP